MKKLIHIGTSGWFYEHWIQTFYPNKLPAEERLTFYSRYFSCVEINSTFYHLPSEQAVKNWAARTPSDFVFAIKASRYITHLKRLNDYETTVPNFLQQLRLLGKKLGPILFQLPPSFQKDENKIAEFLDFLPRNHLYVFEFRHPSWYSDNIYSLLKKHNCCLCITDLNGSLSPLELTSQLVYIRLHGPSKAYRGSYSASQLKNWHQRITDWSSKKLSTYCFFDNDEKGYAIKDAFRLEKLFEK